MLQIWAHPLFFRPKMANPLTPSIREGGLSYDVTLSTVKFLLKAKRSSSAILKDFIKYIV